MSWDDFVDFYLGQVGIRPDEFYELTMKEVILAGESWKIKNNLEWERTRYLASITKNAGIIARGQKVVKADLSEPTQLFSLPQDKMWSRIKKLPKSTLKGFKDFFKKAVSKGVKFKEEPDFDKLKGDHR